MTARARWLSLTVVAVIVLLAAGGYGVWAFVDYRARMSAAIPVDTVDTAPTGPRILFRNTTLSEGYGLVATVPLDAPDAARAVSSTACDRVHASEESILCLRTNRALAATFEAILYDSEWNELTSWPLPGVPSRARVSADSELLATTSFVTGHSYATIGFSTQTTISSPAAETAEGAGAGTGAGTDFGNLEDFTTLIDGQPLTAVDRNFWGVTFAADDTTFYATAASGDQTWLVKGDLDSRQMQSLRTNAECPSLSPGGRYVAYKKNVADGPTKFWSIAVLDLATGAELVLPESRNVDDQIEWLDDDTLLYGLARSDAVGDSDIWSITRDGVTDPQVFIEHAWSPAVVRG